MCNSIAKKTKKTKGFWLGIALDSSSATGAEFLGEKLPFPNARVFYRGAGGIAWWWLIDGYFATSKNTEYLNDIIARFLLTFAAYKPHRVPYKPKTAYIEHTQSYKLKEFSRKLNSIKKKIHIPQRASSYDDFAFWAIKFYAEDLIRQDGFIVYKSLESWALKQFVGKERSTIRAKCRSIWQWYADRDFKIREKKYANNKEKYKGTQVTRVENMRKVGKDKAEKNRRAVINVLTGRYASDYKKKNGNWHFGKIAKATGLSSKTVAKIVKEVFPDSIIL